MQMDEANCLMRVIERVAGAKIDKRFFSFSARALPPI